MQDPARRMAQSAARADAIFIPDNADNVPQVVAALQAAGVNLKRMQMLGTGLWDDVKIYSTPSLHGGWFPAPDRAGFRSFAQRYKARYNQEPVRTATLAYDAVALVAALQKTQGPGGLTEQALTNPSGFAGIDGVFRFRADGLNERGLAVMEVTMPDGRVISPAPRSFGAT
jgi:ABC-type branched-subunit amino acid transport system substrate-binding protein